MLWLLLFLQGPLDYVKPGGPDSGLPRETRGTFPVLFSTLPGNGNTVATQRFLDTSPPGLTITAADDFQNTEVWLLSEVEVRGTYFEPFPGSGQGPAESVNVYIFIDNGGIPNTTDFSLAQFIYEEMSYVDAGTGDFVIHLPTPALLMPGHYWIAVIPNMNLVGSGQWGWTESSLDPVAGTYNFEKSVYYQEFALGACPTMTWSNRFDDCGLGDTSNPPADYDMAFELRGNILPPGVAINPTTVETVEDGSNQTYDVVLDSPPLNGETVTINISGLDTSEGSLSSNSLMFSAANWDVPQTVTITPGASGDGNDGDVMYTLAHTVVASASTGYGSVIAADVDVTNRNIEGLNTILVDPLAGHSVSEDGITTSTVSFQVTTNPSADVTINLAPSANITVSPNPVVLPMNSTGAVMVTITGVNDFIDQPNQPFMISVANSASGDPGFNDIDLSDISGQVTDDDQAGFIIREIGGAPIGQQTVSEAGGTDDFEVMLTTEPLAGVSVILFVSQVDEATISTPLLNYTSTNWNIPQPVTITGLDDLVDDGDDQFLVVTEPALSSDPAYTSLDANDIQVQNIDDDQAGVTVNPISGLVTSESGTTDTFNVVLESQPVFPVEVTLQSSDPTEGLISSDGLNFSTLLALTFDGSNWNTAQTVTVQGQDDQQITRADGDVVFQIISTDVIGGDIAYDVITGLMVDDVEVTNTDDDGPANIVVAPISGLTTDENGLSDSFTVVLGTQPTDTVSINISSSQPTEALPDQASLVFTAGNWNVPQTVTVIGLPDGVIDSDVPFTITLDPAVSGDGNYSGIDPDDVSGTNLNVDQCGPVQVQCINAGPLEISGTPFCVVDIYETNQSTDPNDWVLLAAGIDLGASGYVMTSVNCPPDSLMAITESGTFRILNSPLFGTVPTLQGWASLSFLFALVLLALTVRSKRVHS